MVPARRATPPPLRPGRGALWPAGRRSYASQREERGAGDAAFAIGPRSASDRADQTAQQVDDREATTSEPIPHARDRRSRISPDLDFGSGRSRPGTALIARWPTGSVPEKLPLLQEFEPLEFKPLVEGADFVVERPTACPEEPIETWLVENTVTSRVHPTANERIHRFVVVGQDVGATIPAGSGGAGAFERLDAALVQMMLDIAAPNGTLAVRARDGRLVYSKSITWVTWYKRWFENADLREIPEGEHLDYLVRPDGTNRMSVTSPCSNFKWMSVTKPMVALTALQMAASPNIDVTLNSPVFPRRVGPERAPWFGFYEELGVLWAQTSVRPQSFYDSIVGLGGASLPAIRLWHLISHTAGWSNNHSTDFRRATTHGAGTWNAARSFARTHKRTYPLDPADVLKWLLSDRRRLPADDEAEPTIFDQLLSGTAYPPGKAYLYSNPGYTLLAQLLAHVHGDTIHRTLHDWIFEPCGMERARLADRCTLAERQPGDALLFARASEVEFEAADATGDGWNVERDTYATSQSSPSFDFPGVPPKEWWPYGPRDERLYLGAVGLRAPAAEVTRFGHAVAQRNTGSPLLDSAWRNALWLTQLSTIIEPTGFSPRSRTLGFGRDWSLSGTFPNYLDHSGAGEGCAAYLIVSGQGMNAASRALPPDDGVAAAFSFNRRRSYDARTAGNTTRERDYPINPQATVRFAMARPSVRLAILDSTGDLDG